MLVEPESKFSLNNMFEEVKARLFGLNPKNTTVTPQNNTMI